MIIKNLAELNKFITIIEKEYDMVFYTLEGDKAFNVVRKPHEGKPYAMVYLIESISENEKGQMWFYKHGVQVFFPVDIEQLKEMMMIHNNLFKLELECWGGTDGQLRPVTNEGGDLGFAGI